MMRPLFAAARSQRGFTLMEVLVSIVILSLGVLALVKLQANAAKMATDARQRAEATFLADQLVARMLISDKTTKNQFAHRASGDTRCAPTGSDSTNAHVVEWLRQVEEMFPTSVPEHQQVIVTASDDVTVRLCWKNGANDDVHFMEVTNRVQWP